MTAKARIQEKRGDGQRSEFFGHSAVVAQESRLGEGSGRGGCV